MDWEMQLAQIILQISDPKVARMACEMLVAIAHLYLADHPTDDLVNEIVKSLRTEIARLDDTIANDKHLTEPSQSA